MTTLAIDHLGLAFAGYIFFAAVLAIFFGRALGLNDKLAKNQLHDWDPIAERREQEAEERTARMRAFDDGEWSRYLEQRRARRERAEQRHALNEKSGPRRANDRAA